MIKLKQLENDEPGLTAAPLVRCANILFTYLAEHGAIGLTRTGAFKRKFVLWAANKLQWEGYDLELHFKVSKVLNEHDYLPLEMLHFLLRRLNLIRHQKGNCRLTRNGAKLVDEPGKIFNLIAPLYLFEIDHAALSRVREQILGNWDVFLGVLNEEAKHGVSCAELRQILYGKADANVGVDYLPSMIHTQVLKPLCWIGLLVELNSDTQIDFGDRHYVQTQLWETVFDSLFDVPEIESTRH